MRSRSALLLSAALPFGLIFSRHTGSAPQQGDQLVAIAELTPHEHRAEVFVLASPQTLRIEAVGGEPRRERNRWQGKDGDSWSSEDDERDTWPAAAWIIDSRTRDVVWDLRTAETTRDRNGVRHFSGTVRLPAGTFVAHFGSYVATSISYNGDGTLSAILRAVSRRRNVRYSGPYVDDGSYRDFRLVVRGEGRRGTEREAAEAARPLTEAAIASLRPDSASATERYGFELTRAADVEVAATGEMWRTGDFDYGWILNADTRQRVWAMDYRHTQDAGGAHKNRMAHETLHLPPGHYVAYYVTDGSHDPFDWNAVPPYDPDAWGMTLRISDAVVRAAVRPFAYEPVPAGQTIVSMVGIGDDELRSEGFTLRRPMEVRIYAMGEGSNADADQMDDYAWIVDAGTRRRLWTMRYEDTEHAGGGTKNRVYDGTLQLAAGSYMVYYKSDGSHSFGHWNDAPPAEARYWGVSVLPARGALDRSAIGPFERPGGGTAIAELVHMRDDVRARRSFELDREQAVRVYAIGEGDGDEMYDYGWIEDASTGRTVWEMTYRNTTRAGGARKNRLFDGTIRLPAGRYVLRWESDGSHAYGEWNDDPPDDPEGWGIAVLPARDR